MQASIVFVNLNLVSKVKGGQFSKCACASHTVEVSSKTMDLNFGVLW